MVSAVVDERRSTGSGTALAEPLPPVPLATVARLLLGLNREQRRAVTHLAGPALVVAGPGTGKTEVVTRRVAWLIAARHAQPREILALTFTDNAAQEMQARVDMLVPYGQADTNVHTFHAFGDRLIREFSFELGLPGDVRLLGRAELIVLLREHLFELGLERYRPLGDPSRFVGALVDFFGRAKDEGVSVADLQAHVDSLLARAHEAEGTDRAGLLDLAAARGELTSAYRRYLELLGSRALIDHADQVALALKLITERPSVREAIGRRFRYLLVDELQDTNQAQMDLVLALAGESRNVFAVGDQDQGIYGFRGAVAGNVDRFASAFPDARRVFLTRNYRSRASIVRAAARLREATGARDGARQVAHRRGGMAALRHLAFGTFEEEADGIALEVAKRIRAGARPRDFAVLVRSNGETEAILRSLLVRDVPAQNGAKARLFDLPAVRRLVAYMRVVADPRTDLELYLLATGEPYSLSGTDLAALLHRARRSHRPLWDILVETTQESANSGTSPATRAAIRLLINHVHEGLARSSEHPSADVLYGYLRRSGMLARLARLDPAGPDAAGLRGVARLFELIRERASLLEGDRLPFLVPHLSDENQDDDLADAGPADDRVSVLTVHRAKGLEFKVVYICGLVDGRFPVRARPAALSLPPELCGDDEPSENAHLAEERRLFYVAVTRGRDEVCLSHHFSGPNGRGSRRPSPFLAEALDVPASSLVGAGTATASRNDLDVIDSIGSGLPGPVEPLQASTVGALSLSFSQMDEYMTCPERYRLRYVLGVPTPPHHALGYGGALHHAVAAFHVAQANGRVMTEDELLSEFAHFWTPEGFLSREHERARFVEGQAALRRFRVAQIAAKAAPPVAVERPFTFKLGSDEVRGRYDRLDRTAEGLVITDYKSSDVRDQRKADQKARDSLQLQVYALAHQAETGELPIRTDLYFLESGLVGHGAPDPARLAKARDKLQNVARGVRAAQFAPTPSAQICGYCPYRTICPVSVA